MEVSGLTCRFLLRSLVFSKLIRVPQIPTDHTGPVPQWNNEIRGISVYHRLYHLVSINPLYQSSQGPGNPSRSEVLSTDTPHRSPPSALLRPMWLKTGSHGKSFSHFAPICDAFLAVCWAFFAVQRNPTLTFHLPFLSLTFTPCFCATFLKIKSFSLALTPLSCHHFVFPCTLSKGTEFNFRKCLYQNHARTVRQVGKVT